MLATRLLTFALICVATLAGARAQEPESCPRLVASGAPRIFPAALGRDEVALTFLGHATFLIETPEGVRVATDYNDYVRAPLPLDIITMNKAHSTHFTTHPPPEIPHVLRGWNPAGGPVKYDLTVRDMRVRNVQTNIRDWRGGTDYDGNSMFVFESRQICIGHLGHLHHELTAEHLKQLGRIDVLLVPVDGGLTLNIAGMFENVKKIAPQLIIPMHYFNRATLERFLDLARRQWPVDFNPSPSVVLTREALPVKTRVLVLPGQ
jgi:L-ascorbate metabolism protein UlaG (beta-lactamase superfamily)